MARLRYVVGLFFRLFWNLGLKSTENITFELKPESGDAVVWPDKDKTLLGANLYPSGDIHFEELQKVGKYNLTLKRADEVLFTQGSKSSLILIFSTCQTLQDIFKCQTMSKNIL